LLEFFFLQKNENIEFDLSKFSFLNLAKSVNTFGQIQK
jgi:hypothetical protein